MLEGLDWLHYFNPQILGCLKGDSTIAVLKHLKVNAAPQHPLFLLPRTHVRSFILLEKCLESFVNAESFFGISVLYQDNKIIIYEQLFGIKTHRKTLFIYHFFYISKKLIVDNGCLQMFKCQKTFKTMAIQV